LPFNPLRRLYPVKKLQIRIRTLKEVSCNFLVFHLPDIASLPAGLFSTPTKLSWRHACIAPLPADLFSIPAGLQTLPTALIYILFCFSFMQMAMSGVTLKNLDTVLIFSNLIRNFEYCPYSSPEMFYF
jgi:hypothetical protein